MRGMFYDFNSLISLDLSNFNTKNVTNMSHMFFNCNSLKSLDLSNFNTQNVIHMNSIFRECNSLKSLDLSNFNTQNVTDMCWMFSGSNSLKKENIEIKINGKIIEFTYYYQFNKEGKYIIEYSFKNNLTKICDLFCDCESLKNLDLSNFNTQNVTDMSGMFYYCNIIVIH